jgi:hypothetical protein
MRTSSDTVNKVLTGIQAGIDAIGLLNQVPWMMTLLTTFAFLPGPMRVFNDWSNQAVEYRKKVSNLSCIAGNTTNKVNRGDLTNLISWSTCLRTRNWIRKETIYSSRSHV